MVLWRFYPTESDSCSESTVADFEKKNKRRVNHVFAHVCAFVCFRIRDIGLEFYSKEQLFGQLLLPIVVLIVVILHIHYFYSPMPEDFQSVVAESRRQRKNLRNEEMKRRKLVSSLLIIICLLYSVNKMSGSFTNWSIHVTSLLAAPAESHRHIAIPLAIFSS